MDKSQFQLPKGEYNDESNRARLESFRASPEKLNEGPFKVIKALENTIFDRRATAVAIEQANGRVKTIPYLNMQVHLPARSKEAIYQELIEKERLIGGAIYQNGEQGGYGFWLDYKGSSLVSNDVADWHLEIPNTADPKNPYGVHIETTDWHLKKFHKDGKLYPMTIQDIERFVPAVYLYARETLKLYPFDQNFEDILNTLDIPEEIAALLPASRRTAPKSDDARAV